MLIVKMLSSLQKKLLVRGNTCSFHFWLFFHQQKLRLVQYYSCILMSSC